MKKLIPIFCFSMLSLLSYGQQDLIFSQFMFKKMVVNPAYAGSGGAPILDLFHRQQWAGLEGAPMTQAISFSTPAFAERVGLGVTLINDNIGYFNSSYFNFAYAYRIDTESGGLGIGLQGSYRHFYTNWEKSETIHPGDPIIGDGSAIDPIFNVGFGIYFETKKYYIGASVPRFLKKGSGDNGQGQLSDFTGESPHFYFMTGLLVDLSKNVKLRPGIMVKYAKNAPLNTDFHLSLGFREKFWFGTTYRWGASKIPHFNGTVVFMAQYQISQRLKAGLAYDYALSEIKTNNGGTYALMLEYAIIRDGKGVRNPRFF